MGVLPQSELFNRPYCSLPKERELSGSIVMNWQWWPFATRNLKKMYVAVLMTKGRFYGQTDSVF